MHPGPRTGRLAGVVAALATLAACSGDAGPAPAADPAEPERSAVLVHRTQASEPTPRLELRSRVTRVAGQLSDVRRERVARQVRASLVDYLEGAFAGGDHPFRGFVPGLRRSAEADARVLRGTGRPAAGGSGTTRAVAWLSVAAPGGRPVGVTARVYVELPDDDSGQPPTLTGRLLLTRQGQQWRVFGYDLARGHGMSGR